MPVGRPEGTEGTDGPTTRMGRGGEEIGSPGEGMEGAARDGQHLASPRSTKEAEGRRGGDRLDSAGPGTGRAWEGRRVSLVVVVGPARHRCTLLTLVCGVRPCGRTVHRPVGVRGWLAGGTEGDSVGPRTEKTNYSTLAISANLHLSGFSDQKKLSDDLV
jgi:hypothetical protein